MSNEVNNLAHSFVAMAQAYERLPQVQTDLDQALDHVADQAQTIQRLELRLIDLKAELDTAHANTRKVEVERDHAERMFLETDDRLNAFRRLLAGFQTEAGALIAAAEPEPKPEPVNEVLTSDGALPPQEVNETPMQGQGADRPTDTASTTTTSPSETVSSVATSEDHVDTSSSQPEGVSVSADPTQATPDAQHSPADSSANAGENNATTETAGSTQPEGSLYNELKEANLLVEAPHPVDPTVSATPTETGADVISTGVSESTTASAPTTTAQSSDSTNANEDDVGYHNEPAIGPSGGPDSWQAWDSWCSRMNRKYGGGSWPARPQVAAQ